MGTSKTVGGLTLAERIEQANNNGNGHNPEGESDWEKLEKVLHAGGQHACYWTLDKLFHWFPCGNPGNPPQNYKDIYFSVHPTNIKGDATNGIKNETVSAINSFYAEFDGKDFIPVTDDEINREIQDNPDKYKTGTEENRNKNARKAVQERVFMSNEEIRNYYKSLALEHVQALDPQPSYCQDSGGGYHCFWFLTETFFITDENNRQKIQDLQRKWVTFVGGDQGAKDLRRVLRVPETTNAKYTPNLKVDVLWANYRTRYTLAKIEELVRDIEETKKTRHIPNPSTLPGTRPGDVWASKTTWDDILSPKGWKHLYDKGNQEYWQRPNKRGNLISATTNYKENNALWVFSSNAPPFEANTGYSKFTAYVFLNFGTSQSDFKKAAQEIVRTNPEYAGIENDDWLFDFLSENQKTPTPANTQTPVETPQTETTQNENEQNEETPNIEEIYKIVENEELSTAERVIGVNTLANALARKGAGIIEVSIAAQKVKDAHIPGIGKTTFSNAVREAFKAFTSENPAEEDHTPTDDEIAGRFLASHPNTAFGLGYFRRYKDGHWPIIDEILIDREIIIELVKAKAQGVRPSSARIESVRTILRDVTYKTVDEWDKNKNIIVAKNGTIETPTRKLREHDPKDYATSAVPYDYDPNAVSDIWNRVIARLPSEEGNNVRGFIQEYAGLCLTPEQKYEIALWFQGKMGCGKSTIIEGVKAMLGPGKHCTLGLRQIERSNFALTNLPGKTLAVSTEQPSGFFTALDILNAIISGETVSIDIKFKDPCDINPIAKLLWAMNDLPIVRDPNNGLFRRVKVVKFAELSETDKNENIKEAVKQSGAAILNWALEGLEKLQKRGHFEIPKSVTDATNEFKNSSDIPLMFLEDQEFCERGSDKETKSSLLYAGYRHWCEKNGHKPQSSTSIADEWKRLELTKIERADGNYWQGVKMIYILPAYA